MDATQWATFWVFAALVVFLGALVYLKVPGMAVAALDKRAEKIKAELEEARRLREEAEALLREYQRKRGEAES
jgi:F-type H+-transporting ATPase subunit b